MNKFKRLLFSKNPFRLPRIRSGEAAIWNDAGTWRQDVGNGPQDLHAGLFITETVSISTAKTLSVSDMGKEIEGNGALTVPYPPPVEMRGKLFMLSAIGAPITISGVPFNGLHEGSVVSFSSPQKALIYVHAGGYKVLSEKLGTVVQYPASAYNDETAANSAESPNVVYYNRATGKLQITTA